MPAKPTEFQTLPVPPLALGESPVWDEQEQALYFIDILAPQLHRLDMQSHSLHSWRMPATIGSFGLCRTGGLILALRTGVHLFAPLAGTFKLLAQPEPHIAHNRLNDGKVGPDGRFYVGSMDDRPERAETAALYRIDHDGTCTRIIDHLRVSNGLAWSGDGRTMYHSDTRHEWVRIHDFDVTTGNLSNMRTLCSLSEAEGRPDGAAMDAAGYYWSAGVSAGCLNRIAPDGSIARKLHLPMAAPTMPCFGGPDMKTLFVTSLTKNGQAGTLVALRVEVPGIAIERFGPVTDKASR